MPTKLQKYTPNVCSTSQWRSVCRLQLQFQERKCEKLIPEFAIAGPRQLGFAVPESPRPTRKQLPRSQRTAPACVPWSSLPPAHRAARPDRNKQLTARAPGHSTALGICSQGRGPGAGPFIRILTSFRRPPLIIHIIGRHRCMGGVGVANCCR